MKTISKTITNQDLSPAFFDHNFTRDELRAIARTHGLEQGKTKDTLAFNVSYGIQKGSHEELTFPVILSIKVDE